LRFTPFPHRVLGSTLVAQLRPRLIHRSKYCIFSASPDCVCQSPLLPSGIWYQAQARLRHLSRKLDGRMSSLVCLECNRLPHPLVPPHRLDRCGLIRSALQRNVHETHCAPRIAPPRLLQDRTGAKHRRRCLLATKSAPEVAADVRYSKKHHAS
jgi:hypothetical protein